MRLIDADTLRSNIDCCDIETYNDKLTILEQINEAPTVDAVEVVRCRDCKQYDLGVCLKIYSDGAVSQYAWQARNKDDFCSYGERKDGDGMDEYIDREALIEWLKRIPLIDLSDGHGLCRVIMEDDFKKAIKKMPKGIIADVAPVRHGLWKWDTEDIYRCSNCAEKSHVKEVMGHPGWDYCPNCGAKMDGGEQDA